MISQRSIFLILTTLTAWEYFPTTPRTSVWLSLGIVVSFSLSAISLTLFAGLMASRRDASAAESAVWSRRRNLGENCWCMAYASAMLLAGVMTWIKIWQVEFLPGSLAIILILLPHVIFVAASEMIWTMVGHSDQSCIRHRWSHCLTNLRLGEMSTLVFGVAPVIVLSAVHDGWLTLSRLGVPTSVLLSWLLPILYVCFLLFPSFCSFWMAARRIADAGFKHRIQELMRGVGVANLSLREVPSHGVWTGAAIVGWLPASRQLWVGDGLRRQLNREELDMVLLHELAHIQCGHHWRRVFPIGIALAFGVLAFASCRFWMPEISLWLAPIFATLISIFALIVGVGVTSRECELEADRVACRFAADCCEWTGGRPHRAAMVLGNALLKVSVPGCRSFRKRSWLHPSLRERRSGLARDLVRLRS